MPTYPFFQVDAFTDQPLGGNPCAVLFDTDGMNDATMLAIAREMNLSETAFVRRSKTADFGVRYFTPAEEIPLAGHPTIATVFALVDAGRLALTGERTSITLELQVGPIPVEIFASGGRVQRIVMTQKEPQFLATHDPAEVLPLFGLSPDDALPNVPIQTVSTGTPQLMIPLRGLDVLRRAQVNIPAYEAYRARSDFFSPHLFCLQGITSEGQTFARHFGVPPDTPEDPVTGSATGGMAAYLWHYNLIENPVFIAEQGHWMKRPGKVFVEVIGPRAAIETVKIGGSAATIMRGEIVLQPPTTNQTN
ncbi:MAG: PhzF family phenazine biosynthesis protein [Chloroflexi bacterium]|nr:PhzF family phenazine biosynthesis protein [Chloroflexota bacterium]